MSNRILIVDDDRHLLSAMQRHLHEKYDVCVAESGLAGLEVIDSHGPFSVVVADMHMPRMDGIHFLKKICERSKDTIRMMLTGNTDQQTAMDAVNEGHIFRFLTKPCSSENLIKALDAGIEQHRLVTAERELLSQTLAGSVKILTEILSLVNPKAFAIASRVRRMAADVASRLDAERPWEIELAAMLSQVGWVIEPDETLFSCNRASMPSPAEVSESLIANIPRLESVADIVAKCRDDLGDDSAEIPLSARVLRIVLDYDGLVDQGMLPEKALESMLEQRHRYDGAAFEALKGVVESSRNQRVVGLAAEELFDGAILADDIRTAAGQLLLRRGQELSAPLRLRLLDFAATIGIEEPIRVYKRLVQASPEGVTLELSDVMEQGWNGMESDPNLI